jgi:[lysine-biosynthesis-protein LysW]--L-2-aminoadipate ligase
MKIGMLHSRIRAEEKLLLQAFNKRGIEVDLMDDRKVIFEISSEHCFAERYSEYDVVVERCINHSRALYSLRILNDRGIKTVNSAEVAAVCGNKLETTSALTAHGVPTPRTLVAFTPESALEAIDELGYPVVLKPAVGSWGRLLSKINDRDCAEAILEHKEILGSYHHSIFYIQEYTNKPMRDIRAFVIGGEVVAAIYRHSDHWITNTARGGESSNCPISDEMREICRKGAIAVGGGTVALDLVEDPDKGLLVLEVNYTMEFRNSIEPTGVDIPDRMVDFVLNVGENGWKEANNGVAV